MRKFGTMRRRGARSGQFLLDESGFSAVEFALILPMMLVIYLGGFSISQALSINRLVTLTSGTVTNIVSQYTTISIKSQMPDILLASSKVLSPYPVANTKVVVSAITVDSAGKASISWSQTLNGTPRTAGKAIVLPPALSTPNSTVILGETSYAYTPLIQYVNLGTINLYSSVYMLPRAATNINLVP